MDQGKFNSIIDFAIDREKEAVLFYQALQRNAKFNGMKDFLQELEKMEEGHIKVLQSIGKTDVSSMKIPQVDNMKISDYLVPVNKPVEEMDYQDIVITAMKREEASYNLYTSLSANFSDPDTKKLFEKLASEEAKHKLKFEEIYDNEVLKDN